MNASDAFLASQTNQLDLSYVSEVLKNRVLSLNVFYGGLDYTLIDQEPKYQLAVKSDI